MTDNLFIIIILLAFFFGFLFFIADFYEHGHIKLHVSLIAGISLAYFFLLVLPEISDGMPEYPLHLKMFEYVFILIGFVFIHLTEKFILQKVEAKSLKRMRKLLTKEKNLEIVEKNIEILINNEIKRDSIDEASLRHLSQTLSSLNEQEDEIKKEIDIYKSKIQAHIYKDFGELRFFTNYIYHLLVGIILVGLLIINIFSGILFFIFSWFRTIISNRSDAQIIFTDLEIYDYIDIERSFIIKIILASAALIGILIGLITEFILTIELELELIYILFSFISGVILYSIIRTVIPEKEKGNPLYFLIGVVGFSLIIFVIKISTSLLS